MTELVCDWVQSRWRIVDSATGEVLGIHKHLSIGVPLRCVTIANNTRGVIECEGVVKGTEGETGIKADTGVIVGEDRVRFCQYEIVPGSTRGTYNDGPALEWKCRNCGQSFCTPMDGTARAEDICTMVVGNATR